MMKSLVTLFFLPTLALAQVDSSKLEYYPLQVGDVWQYTHESGGRSTLKIIGDTTINGEQYFTWPSGIHVRVDSLYRVVHPRIGQEGEYNPKYRLNEPLGSAYELPFDVAGVTWSNPRYIMKYAAHIEGLAGPGMDAMIFNPEAIDTVSNDTSSYGFQFILVKGLGVYREEYEAERFMQLTGAITNGVQWGTIVSVEDNLSSLPTQYVLSQNYPNPFNPRTTIEYSVPNESRVSIMVYNLLGEQVQTLVEGHSQGGHYKVSFDASLLPSGMYIYRLSAGKYTEVRKMILLR